MSVNFISFDIPNSFPTIFTSNKILELINECLFEYVKPRNITISEEIYDQFYDNFDQDNVAAKIWNIEFYKPVNMSCDDVIVSRYIIRVTYLVGKNNEPNLVIFKDISNVGGHICEDRMFSLKYFITKKDKAHRFRYLEREPFLLLIKGSVTNYDDFSAEDLEKINAEKTTSKKRRVLENPWLQREISEYIDYIQPEIDISQVMGCFRRRYK
jgi:hypothetical protein